MKLTEDFYCRSNVVQIARELLGKSLHTLTNGQHTSGLIVETEAYSWKERGCHAFGGRKTTRNAVMFEPGGLAYVYLCYGMHHMFNVVTNVAGKADAVLIRAVEPMDGADVMVGRRGNKPHGFQLTSGPGKLAQALGIDRSLNGKWLGDGEVWIEDHGQRISKSKIDVSARIGIDYAGDDAKLPWRFSVKLNPWVSKASRR